MGLSIKQLTQNVTPEMRAWCEYYLGGPEVAKITIERIARQGGGKLDEQGFWYSLHRMVAGIEERKGIPTRIWNAWNIERGTRSWVDFFDAKPTHVSDGDTAHRVQ